MNSISATDDAATDDGPPTLILRPAGRFEPRLSYAIGAGCEALGTLDPADLDVHHRAYFEGQPPRYVVAGTGEAVPGALVTLRRFTGDPIVWVLRLPTAAPDRAVA